MKYLPELMAARYRLVLVKGDQRLAWAYAQQFKREYPKLVLEDWARKEAQRG